MTYYKTLSPDGEPVNGGTGKWNLPTDDRPGDWMPQVEGELIPCSNGYHVCLVSQLPQWIRIPCSIYEVEPGEEVIHAWGKSVCRTARLIRLVGVLDRQKAVRWACDCAERVLEIFERQYPDDDRPRKAIQTARRWLIGEATTDECSFAADAVYAVYAAYAAYDAHDAADAAVYAAYAADAAIRAVYAAYAAYAAVYAVYAAYDAHDAAYAAASAAAHAAYDADAAAHAAAEQEWQGKRLLEILEDTGSVQK